MHVHYCSHCGQLARKAVPSVDACAWCELVRAGLLDQEVADSLLCGLCAEWAKQSEPDAEELLKVFKDAAEAMRQFNDDLTKPVN